MSCRIAKKLSLISVFAILLTGSAAWAGNLFEIFHCKPKCPPYWSNCFGFTPTQWRIWPAECTPPRVVSVAPARMPMADEDKTPKEPGEKQNNIKKEPKLPEPEPAPQSSAGRDK